MGCWVSPGAPSIINPNSTLMKRSYKRDIEQLAATYPTYGYRRITKLLVNEGYPVGYRRVSRLMKAANLSVSVKRVCRTTNSLERQDPWVNRLEGLDICRCDQVWVGDITYVRLNRRFIYVALLMDVFTRMIRAWRTSESALDAISDFETLGGSLTPKRVSRDPPFRSRRAISFKGLYLTAEAAWR